MMKPILTLAAVAAIATGQALTAEAKAPPAALQNCAGCHDLSPARAQQVGPPLYGIYGKKPQMGGVKFAKWDKKSLDAFLADPQKVKPGSSMPINVPDAKERAAMVKAIEGMK